MTETHTPQDAPSGPQGTPHQAMEAPRAGVATENLRDYTRLRRSVIDRKIAGVAGGLGRHLNIDPTVLRVLFVVLCFFGGAGIVLYAAAWLLVPEEQSDDAVISASPSTRNTLLIIAGVLGAVLVVGDFVGNLNGGFGGVFLPGPIALAALVVLIVLLTRDKSGHHADVPAPTGPASAPAAPASAGTTAGSGSFSYPGAPGAAGEVPVAPAAYQEAPAPASSPGWPASGATAYAPTAPPAGATAYPPTPPAGPAAYAPTTYPSPPRRDRGPVLFGFTLAFVAVALGTLGLYDAAGNTVVDAAYPALALAVIGVMLVVGSFAGRPGGLVALGVLACIALAVTSVADRYDYGRPQRLDAVPASSAQVHDRYSVLAGTVGLDLTSVRDLENLDGRSVELRAEAGEIIVYVPEGLDVAVDAEIGIAGDVNVDGTLDEGRSPRVVRVVDGGKDVPTLTLEADLSVGSIEVRQLQKAGQ
ncbi:PspC domain-containing protein [Nocardioides mesophilus]|uniref:PspC domain-containing protein n=1 Tax=Nocardioides mesophilus TaxID=433659 RepID=A0A7G9R7C3_9ACTN|nr:PspC domain-containing protein [Nocardioides mesophilus]QNN51498.1 PspC domain-containing protein [Nocardioides mesophilus]